MLNKIYPDSKMCRLCEHLEKIRETAYTLKVYCDLSELYETDVGMKCPNFKEVVIEDEQ